MSNKEKSVTNMADYKEMYRKLVQASEAAINILVDAQRECEEMYIASPEAKLTILPKETEKERE